MKNFWTTEEDERLKKLVEIATGRNIWVAIAKQLPGRSAGACRHRFCDYVKIKLSEGQPAGKEQKGRNQDIRDVAKFEIKKEIISKKSRSVDCSQKSACSERLKEETDMYYNMIKQEFSVVKKEVKDEQKSMSKSSKYQKILSDKSHQKKILNAGKKIKEEYEEISYIRNKSRTKQLLTNNNNSCKRSSQRHRVSSRKTSYPQKIQRELDEYIFDSWISHLRQVAEPIQGFHYEEIIERIKYFKKICCPNRETTTKSNSKRSSVKRGSRQREASEKSVKSKDLFKGLLPLSQNIKKKNLFKEECNKFTITKIESCKTNFSGNVSLRCASEVERYQRMNKHNDYDHLKGTKISPVLKYNEFLHTYGLWNNKSGIWKNSMIQKLIKLYAIAPNDWEVIHEGLKSNFTMDLIKIQFVKVLRWAAFEYKKNRDKKLGKFEKLKFNNPHSRLYCKDPFSVDPEKLIPCVEVACALLGVFENDGPQKSSKVPTTKKQTQTKKKQLGKELSKLKGRKKKLKCHRSLRKGESNVLKELSRRLIPLQIL
ncbi:unnamed protein product [Moneuplotes crassus]|uniref:Uncharacterized protein n=1 Tax=Euplotes crassus TaxID=5936 RepID=A0AAD2CW92_EUPCR|nr:unnamed protein product [Moneuplotes crassus]